MRNKFFGYFLIIFPVLWPAFMAYSNLVYFWHFEDNFRIGDLCSSIALFFIFICGVGLVVKNSFPSWVIFYLTLFSIYQILFWHWGGNRFDQKIKVSDGHVVAINTSLGALTTGGGMVMKAITPKYFLFLRYSKFDFLENIRSTSIKIVEDDYVQVIAQSYDGHKSTHNYAINDLFE